jgi:hypothetical protein
MSLQYDTENAFVCATYRVLRTKFPNYIVFIPFIHVARAFALKSLPAFQRFGNIKKGEWKVTRDSFRLLGFLERGRSEIGRKARTGCEKINETQIKPRSSDAGNRTPDFELLVDV